MLNPNDSVKVVLSQTREMYMTLIAPSGNRKQKIINYIHFVM